jgi:hypothetical protein
LKSGERVRAGEWMPSRRTMLIVDILGGWDKGKMGRGRVVVL